MVLRTPSRRLQIRSDRAVDLSHPETELVPVSSNSVDYQVDCLPFRFWVDVDVEVLVRVDAAQAGETGRPNGTRNLAYSIDSIGKLEKHINKGLRAQTT